VVEAWIDDKDQRKEIVGVGFGLYQSSFIHLVQMRGTTVDGWGIIDVKSELLTAYLEFTLEGLRNSEA